jgi:hypothetical protein
MLQTHLVRHKVWLLVISAVTFPMLLCLIWTISKYSHVLWRLSNSSSDREIIAVGIMDNIQCPDGWHEFRIGSLSIRLPSSLSGHWEAVDLPVAGCVFRDPGKSLFVSLPFDAKRTVIAVRQTMKDAVPEDQLNPIDVKIMAYRAGPGDFHWSMTRDELTRLDSLLAYKRLVCSPGVRLLEEVRMHELTGLMSVHENRASLEWFSQKHAASGMVLFGDSADQIDLSWVRPICCSLRFAGSVYPENLPPEGVRGLLRPRGKP